MAKPSDFAPRKVGITLKFNRLRNSSIRGNKSILNDIQKEINTTVESYGLDLIQKRLLLNANWIKGVIDQDIRSYSDLALKFFFQLQSPDLRGTYGKSKKEMSRTRVATTITFRPNGNLTNDGPDIFGAAKVTSSQKEYASGFSVIWEALNPRTVKRKMRSGMGVTKALNYFVDSGALKSELNEGFAMGFMNMLDFKIVSEEKEGTKQVIVKALSNRQLTSSTLTALGGTNLANTSQRRNGPIASYMATLSSKAMENKLSNFGLGVRVERPFLQPIIGFWLVNRFPKIFKSAVGRSINKAI